VVNAEVSQAQHLPGGTIDEGRQFTLLQLIGHFVYISLLLYWRCGVQLSLPLAGSAARCWWCASSKTFKDLCRALLFRGHRDGGRHHRGQSPSSVITAIGLRTSKIESCDAITFIVPNSRLLKIMELDTTRNQFASAVPLLRPTTATPTR